MRALLANYVLDRDNPVSINELRGFTLSDTRPRFYDGLTDRPLTALSAEEVRALRPQALRRLAGARPHDHFVKTHSQLGDYGGVSLIDPAVSAGAIYIVRDPRDMITSYAAHFGIGIDDAIGQVSDTENMTMATDFSMTTYLGRWDLHVESWAGQDKVPVCVVRYEDLVKNPEGVFGLVLRTLGHPVSEERLSRAVRSSSFETMRREEARDGFIERPPHMESFFRAGRAGGWKAELSGEQVSRIEQHFGATMLRYGYSPESAASH